MRKVCELGRSMVEMLGVLAIIGVLSVGGIAGYSKAMEKYKLNKQAEQLSHLLNLVYRHKASWGKNPPSMNLMPYFKAMGEIPEDMIKANSEYIYDVFNYKIGVRTNNCTPLCNEVMVSYSLDDNFDVCLNMINTAKSFSDNLLYLIYSKTTEESESQYSTRLFGDKYCKQSDKCIKDLNMSDIYEECQFLSNKKSGGITFLYSIND